MITSILILIAMFGGIVLLVELFAFGLAEDKDAGIAFLGTLPVVAIVVFLLIFCSSKLNKLPYIREDPYVTHSIIALQDGNEIEGKISGSAFCMSGYIGEEFKYVYGYKTSSGGMKIQKVNEEMATVYFNDDKDPCAEWYKETKKFWFMESSRYTCDIFVPTDSLQAGITIDLK